MYNSSTSPLSLGIMDQDFHWIQIEPNPIITIVYANLQDMFGDSQWIPVTKYLSLPPTRHDLTQGQKPEGRLKWG